MTSEATSKGAESLWRATLLALIVLAIISLAVSFRDAQKYPGGDGRFRVAEARLMLAGHDPYTGDFNDDLRFKQRMWRSKGPAAAYTPALLLCYAPLCEIAYRPQRMIWAGLEWAALFASIFLLRRLLPTLAAKRFFLACSLLFFVASPFWRLHVERGQYYVFLLLLEVISLFVLMRCGKAAWLFTIPLGWLTAMRPSFGVAGLVLLALGRWRSAMAFFLSVSAFVGMTLPLVGIHGWLRSFEMARHIGFGMQSTEYLDQHFGTQDVGTYTAEGYTFDGVEANIRTASWTLGGYFHKAILRLAPRLTGSDMYSQDKESHIVFAVTLMMILGIFWLVRKRLQTPAAIMLACFAAMLYADLFVQVRFSYADVLALLPLALLILLCFENPCTWIALAALIGGLVVANGYWSWLGETQCERVRPMMTLISVFVALLIQIIRTPAPAVLDPTPTGTPTAGTLPG